MDTKLTHAHANMVEQQIRPSDVLDENVLSAMRDLPRAFFVEEEYKPLAYADVELPIGYQQMMLTPTLEGRLLQALQLKKDEQVLEIGTGSGYFTALLASQAQHVYTIEIIEELSQQATDRHAALSITNITYQVGDASHGWTLTDRLDAIVMTGAVASLPDDYLHKLKVGGRLLAIVGAAPAMKVQMVKRVNEWEWVTENLFESEAPLLINAEPKPTFSF